MIELDRKEQLEVGSRLDPEPPQVDKDKDLEYRGELPMMLI